MDIIVDLKLKINITTTKGNIKDVCLVIFISFVTSTLFVSSYDLSFAIKENEINRIYKFTNRGTVEVLPFYVPRKSELFQVWQ